MLPLANAIASLHAEHMKNEDFEGFTHDLSVLIAQALMDGFDDSEMTTHVNEYIKELIEVNKED